MTDPETSIATRLRLASRFVVATRPSSRGDEYGIPEITIEKRGPDAWCIAWGGEVFNRAKGWNYEPQPSSRTDEFISFTRFTLDEAFALAPEAIERAKAIMVGGGGVTSHV